MNYLRLLGIVGCILLISIYSSCRRKGTVRKIDPGFESHYAYKAGSYWIYKDSLTGDIDSFAVTAYEFRNLRIDNSGNTYDIIDIHIQSFPLGIHINDSVEIRFGLQEKVFGQTYRTKDRPSPYTFETTLYPYSEVPTNDGQLKIPSITIDGVMYTNVVMIKAWSNDYYNDWFYYSEDKGIIKMRISTYGVLKRVWELQAAHIVH